MGSTLLFPGTSAEHNFPPVVTYSPTKSYRLPRPCTVRATENGRWVGLEYSTEYGEYLPVYFSDRRADAALYMYKLVNASDDLIMVDTCQECWKEIRGGDQRTCKGDAVYCSIDCAKERESRATLMLRGAVIGTGLLLVYGGFGAGLYEAAKHIFAAFGVR